MSSGSGHGLVAAGRGVVPELVERDLPVGAVFAGDLGVELGEEALGVLPSGHGPEVGHVAGGGDEAAAGCQALLGGDLAVGSQGCLDAAGAEGDAHVVVVVP